MAHDSFDHLQAIILGALQLCDSSCNDIEGRDELIDQITASFQQLKNDELEAIEWDKLKDFLNSLCIELY